MKRIILVVVVVVYVVLCCVFIMEFKKCVAGWLAGWMVVNTHSRARPACKACTIIPHMLI